MGGVDKTFVVTSIDISASLGPPEGAPLLRGLLGGVEKWSIDPDDEVGFVTYTSATTGNLAEPIDQLIWSAPYDPASATLTWSTGAFLL